MALHDTIMGTSFGLHLNHHLLGALEHEFYIFPFHIWDVIRNPLTNSIIFQDGYCTTKQSYYLDLRRPIKIWVWVNTYRYIFNGMNIHKSQLFWGSRHGTRVLTHNHLNVGVSNKFSHELVVPSCRTPTKMTSECGSRPRFHGHHVFPSHGW